MPANTHERARGHSSKASRRSPGRTISIIGAGRLGTALAIALDKHGYDVQAVVAAGRASARRAAKLIGSRPLSLAAADLDQLPQSSVLLITTPDDEISGVASRLSILAVKGSNARVALHASGALSSAALQSLKDEGFAVGSMHPLVSISDPVVGADTLVRAFFCVEGDNRATRVARGIISALGAKSFSIATEDKALYHASAVMSSGHVVALFDIAVDLLEHCGLSRGRAKDVLLPLLQSTVENVRLRGPAKALTGTYARGDVITAMRHIEALEALDLGEAKQVYLSLGLRSVELARRSGLSEDVLRRVEALLRDSARNR